MKMLQVVLIPLLMGAQVSCQQPDSTADPVSSRDSRYASADPIPNATDKIPERVETNNLRWLVSNSPFIFVGRLSNKTVERDSRNLIITRNRFEVSDVIVGNQEENIVTLLVFGGTMGDESLSLPGMPQFEENHVYVIFTDLARTVYNPITGDQDGVFRVVDSLIYRYDGQGVIGVEDGTMQVGGKVLPETYSLELKAFALTDNPTVSGSIVSVERAAPESGAVIRLDDFKRAVLAATQ
jgi:hypothetical protein